MDVIESNGKHTIYISLNQKGQKSGLRYEDGRWEDVLSAVQTIGRFTVWSSLHLYYKDAGFTSGNTTTIAGQECRLWTGAQGKMATRYADLPLNAPAEIAVWNNAVTMRLKSGNTVILEATAFALNVPDAAFTQLVDVTWIQ